MIVLNTLIGRPSCSGGVWEAFTDEVASEWEFEGGSGQMPEGRHLVLLSHVLHDCIYNQ